MTIDNEVRIDYIVRGNFESLDIGKNSSVFGLYDCFRLENLTLQRDVTISSFAIHKSLKRITIFPGAKIKTATDYDTQSLEMITDYNKPSTLSESDHKAPMVEIYENLGLELNTSLSTDEYEVYTPITAR